MRSRLGSPSPRKYFATRSVASGAAGSRNGAESTTLLTEDLYQNLLMYCPCNYRANARTREEPRAPPLFAASALELRLLEVDVRPGDDVVEVDDPGDVQPRALGDPLGEVPVVGDEAVDREDPLPAPPAMLIRNSSFPPHARSRAGGPGRPRSRIRSVTVYGTVTLPPVAKACVKVPPPVADSRDDASEEVSDFSNMNAIHPHACETSSSTLLSILFGRICYQPVPKTCPQITDRSR